MPAHGTRPRPRRTFRCALLALVLLASALSATTARAASGQITGLVTDATGQPVAGLAVDAYSYARSAEYGAITGSDGRYAIPGLPTDAYTVEFHPRPGGPDYQVTYYDQQAGAGGVNVTDGQTTSGIDAQVQAGPPYGQITGTVRDAGGAPLENIDVVARVMPDDVAWPVAVTTDASGHYAMSNLPAGVYDLVLSSEPRAAVTFGLQRVRGVTVTSGATTGGADAILAPGGTIAGTVVDAQGRGLADVQVTAASGDLSQTAFTGATGGYAVTGLGAGGYTVKFTPPAGGADLVGEFYRQRPNGDGDLVAVTAGELTGGIDTQLEAGGRITGTVTGPSGAPAAGAGVLLTTGGGREVSQWGQVGADGTYAIDDLAPGSYTVRFEAPLGSGLENQYYPGAASLAAAGPVTVAPGATTSGIDARLPRAGIVTGTVIDTLGHPVAGVGVFAFDANAPLPERPSSSGLPLFRATVTTDASGHFELDGLAATSYRVFFSSPDYVPRYYGGSGTYDTATLLTVSASTSTVLADTPIQLAGAIAGTVRDAAGRPLEAFVTVLRGDGTPAGFTVSAGGAYRIGNLAPGRYLVRFAPTTSPDAFFYDGRATEGAADAVTVVAGSTTGGIDGRVPGPNLAAPGPVLGDLHGALVVSRRGSVRVPVRCVGPTGCAGTASLSTLAPGAKGRAHRVRIGWSAFRVGPGRTASQRLLLTVAGRRLLRRHHGRMTAELLVTPTGSRGHPATTQLRSA